VVCAIVPDADVIGFNFGIHYQDFWGHRGFTHSLLFAALLALLITALGFRNTRSSDRSLLCLYFFLAIASHGLLDAMTNGGLGVAFFSPFDTKRYFLSWRPILLSPISVPRFFSSPAILQSEFVWTWLPSVMLAFFTSHCGKASGMRNPPNESCGAPSGKFLAFLGRGFWDQAATRAVFCYPQELHIETY
jgi:inner membrane protein